MTDLIRAIRRFGKPTIAARRLMKSYGLTLLLSLDYLAKQANRERLGPPKRKRARRINGRMRKR